MPTVLDIQNLVKKQNWPPQAEADLAALLPMFGQNMLKHISDQIASIGSEVVSGGLVKAWQVCAGVLQLINSNQNAEAKRKIFDSAEDLSFDNQSVFALARDIYQSNALLKNLQPVLAEVLDVYEINYFEDLYPTEVARILQNSFVHCSAITDLDMEVKRYCYLRELDDPSSRQMVMFRQALETNTENIGRSNLQIDDKKVLPSIRAWISSFLAMGAKTEGRSGFNVAYFLTNSLDVKKLNLNDQQLVMSVLVLYNWLLAPNFSPKELEDFANFKPDLVLAMLGGESEDEASADNKLASAEPQANQKFEGYTKPQNVHKPGLILDNKTNIELSREKQRMAEIRHSQSKLVEEKLAALRSMSQD